jgi:hypothetical protein
MKTIVSSYFPVYLGVGVGGGSTISIIYPIFGNGPKGLVL